MKLRHTFFLFLFLFCSSLFASCEAAKQVYIVYFGGHIENKTTHEIEEKHYSYLLTVKGNKDEAKASLLYSYKHSINGFAAFLTAFEASKLSALKEVIHVVKSHPRTYSPQTTKSWDFLGLKSLNMYEDYEGDQLSTGSSLLLRARYGKDVIVGVFDTGVWPESKSFDDEGMDPIPELWLDKCNVNRDFDASFRCNKKIIGAKYYSKDFEKQYGQLNLTYNKRSPRDMHGHGTHVASIVSGRKVKDVASLGGLAFGNASGGAPMTRLAIYKVCWTTPSFGLDCKPSDMIKAIDDAIADGVHVMSFSLSSHLSRFSKDLVSIAKLRATKKNIIVVCSSGNRGPDKETIGNEAPWVITVGSSSINRMFLATLELGDGTKIKGQTIASYESTNMTSLVYAGNVVKSDIKKNAIGYCTTGSLNSKLVEGKMVLCKSNILVYDATSKIEEVKRARGIGIIVADIKISNAEYSLKAYEAYNLPIIFLTAYEGRKVFKYIKSNKDSALVSVGIPMTTKNDKPAPSVMATSSRGPTTFYRHILKPDIITPGLNIMAAWNEVSSSVNLLDDNHITKYNIQSGTSMATPHVAAVVSLLRAIHSNWSDAAIRSAILTTASPYNNIDNLITDHKGVIATPFSIGHGHLQPTKAVDPGLVYDASFDDYLTYLCGLGTNVRDIDPTFECPMSSHSYDLNHPSITIPYIYDVCKVKRKVTNVGAPKSNYTFEAKPPLGFSVKSTPERLHFEHTSEVKSFTVTVTKNIVGWGDGTNSYVFGYYVWKDRDRKDTSHHVRSPIVIDLH